MKAKEFANKFGVSVEEMCRITELSRQGLNDIVSGKSLKPSKAKRIAIYNEGLRSNPPQTGSRQSQ